MTLFNPVDGGLPGSSVQGILQARILEWRPCLPPGDLPDPGIKPTSLMSLALALAGSFFFLTTSATWEALHRLYLKTNIFFKIFISLRNLQAKRDKQKVNIRLIQI